MKIRQRTKNLIIAGAVGALIVTVISVGVFYWKIGSIQESANEKINRYEAEIEELTKWTENQKKGYAVKKQVDAGTEITEDMLKEVFLPSPATPADLIEKNDIIGRVAKVDLSPNTVITDSIVFDHDEITSKDLREVEYSFIELPTKLETGDFIDIRIQFPDGSDYIVMKKKKVEDIKNGTVWNHAGEEEILTMSSAIVDAYLEDARIYALSYVEPYIQEAPRVTYPVKQNVLELIASSPNIVDVAREELEARNRMRLEKSLNSLTDEQRAKYQSAKEASNIEKMNREQQAEMNQETLLDE